MGLMDKNHSCVVKSPPIRLAPWILNLKKAGLVAAIKPLKN
jgi:hypothetical protein